MTKASFDTVAGLLLVVVGLSFVVPPMKQALGLSWCFMLF